MLRVRSCSVRYGDGVEALGDVSVEVPSGDIVSIVGANGAGKSSLMNAIAGLVPADGSFELAGEPLGDLRPEDRARRGLVLVPEGRRLFANLTVRENLEVAGAAKQHSRRELARHIDAVYDIFPALPDLAGRRAWSLSGGEQQMLAIGRALIEQPTVLLLDEPSLGLAPLIIESVFDVLVDLNREFGTSILLVEQNARMALSISSYTYVLEHGAVTIEGPSSEIVDSPDVQRAYLGA